MIAVPAGRHLSMGSPESETDRSDNEGPQHEVTIGNALAVGRFAVMRGEFAAFVKDTGHKTGRSCYAYTGSTSRGVRELGRCQSLWRVVRKEDCEALPAAV